MLRNPTIYAASTLSPDKPVWHWSQLFTGSAYLGGTDIDLYAEYKGHGIFVETKPLGVMPSVGQARLLEGLAALPRMYVILCGTERQEDRSASVVCWVDVTADKSWRSPNRVTYGSDDEFREYIAELKRVIDIRCTPANDAYFDPRRCKQLALL